jgi:MarR family transcriptional regulator, temperature-dependent positive regulator of motility
MSNDKELAKQLETCYKRLSSSLRTKLRPTFAEFDLRPIDFVALRNIYFQPGITVMALRKELGLPQSTISSMIKRFERMDLITRSVNPLDKRSYCLFVTDFAKEFVTDVLSPRVSHYFLDLVANMNDVEKEGLMTALKSLNHILSDYHDCDV